MTYTDPLRLAASQAPAPLVEEYRALWIELWGTLRAKLGVPCKDMETVREFLLGFLRDNVPVETARMVALEYMKGWQND